MGRRLAPFLLIAATFGCVRPVRVETRETPVETGLPVPFVADGERRWDFGDGTPEVVAQATTHAFHRGGRYVVRSYAGKALREQLTLVVAPRPVFHLVPPDASAAVLSRSLEAFGPAVDFAERLSRPRPVQRWLDEHPLLGWALSQSAAGGGPVDPREGLATFTWDDAQEVRLSVVGVLEPDPALASFSGWLKERGWRALPPVQGLHRFELDERALDVFVDRGALYAAHAPLTGRLPGAQTRIAAASALGLEADGAVAQALDRLPSGELVLYARPAAGLSWKFVTAALRLEGDEAHLEGRLSGGAPLWSVPPVAVDTRLLAHAPEGPVVVASAILPPRELAALLLGAPGTPRRKELERELLAQGTDVDRAVAGFAGLFDLLVYADVPGFVGSTLSAGGRPHPRGTLLLEAPLLTPEPVEALVDALGRRWAVPLMKVREQELRLWRGQLSQEPLEIAVTAQALFLKAGSPIVERKATRLDQALAARFEGAFTAGHLSLLLDLGQLRRELLQPRLMPQVDPRRALTAQALAATLLDELTQLDWAMVDLAPAEDGALLHAALRLRAKEP